MAALITTTLSRALNATDAQLYLTSGSSVTTGTVLFFDGEAVRVTQAVTTTCFAVQRGSFGTAAAMHASGSTVYVGTPDQFYAGDPTGEPNQSPNAAVTTPWINVTNNRVWTVSGTAWVLGSTTTGSATASYPKTTDGAQTLLAAGPVDRQVVISVQVTTAFANGDGAQPTFAIGETGSTSKFAATARFTGASAGATFSFAGTLSATKALLVTAVAATGTTSTGAITVTVIATT